MLNHNVVKMVPCWKKYIIKVSDYVGDEVICLKNIFKISLLVKNKVFWYLNIRLDSQLIWKEEKTI